ncbi:MAG: MBOAT family protein [Planctomycetota bacterium]
MILIVMLVSGYTMMRWCRLPIARFLTWTTLILGTYGIDTLAHSEPAGIRMIVLIIFALIGMKVIVTIEERARGMPPLTYAAWLCFTMTWLGMKPRLFVAAGSSRLSEAHELIRLGIVHMILGAILITIAWVTWNSTQSRWIATFFLLPGLSLLVHFGICNLLAGAWRLRGIACEALFRAPLRSQNLSEFWARRWNLAFSEMTAIAVYRPLAERLGRGCALMAGFALSGILHEIAISLPVRAGFGLPLLYFILHGTLVLFERALERAGHPLSGWGGRIWTMFWLVAPLPILFHQPFLAGVIWPLIDIPPRN